jgi:hypothetical protein
MRQRMSNKFLVILFAILPLAAVHHQPVFCQQISPEQRINELRKLRDELRATESLKNADVAIVIGERMLAHSAKQMEGLEIQLPRNGVLHLDSIGIELAPAAAIVKIGVQAKSSINVNLLLTGRLGTGEVKGDLFQLPFQITDVSISEKSFTSVLLRKFLGDWLTPKKWNEELPPLELPLEIGDALQIRATRFQVEGSLPMEISTPDYHSPLKLKIRSFLVLEKRLALGLEMIRDQSSSGAIVETAQMDSTSSQVQAPQALSALTSEIARLSEGLNCERDLRLKVNRRVISLLVGQIAAARKNDFTITLKECRVRAEEVESLVKVLNYTDVESGSGYADVSHLSIDRIADGILELRLSLQGEVDSKVRGREYGIPYRLAPHTVFSIDDRIVALQTICEGDRVLLRASPGASLPISLRFSIKVAGRDLGINRNTSVQLDRWLNRIEIPSFFGRQFSLPRRLEVDAGGNLYVTRSTRINLTISNLNVETTGDSINVIADASFSL